jgi:hypothetical protein
MADVGGGAGWLQLMHTTNATINDTLPRIQKSDLGLRGTKIEILHIYM